MAHIPLFNLQAQLKPLQKTIFSVWKDIYEHTSFTSGKETEEFEKKFAHFCATKYAIATRSGTSALIVALKSIGIQHGDEVITTPTTFTATTDAIILTGGEPIFCDVLSETGNIDPALIEAKITKKTRAILLVHLYGVPCDMDAINTIAKKHKLSVIEDASHAHGSLYKRKRVGSLGDIACFSLYPSKTLGSLGNAGVITTNNLTLAQKAQMFANHGIKNSQEKYTHHVSGYNELIDNLQAAALNIKLPHLKKWIARKKEIALFYNRICKEAGHPGMIWSETDSPSIYMYSLQIENREDFQHFFSEQEIDTGIYYPTPLHLQPSLTFLNIKKGSLPNAEKFFRNTVSLPCFPELSQRQVNHIGLQLQKYLAKNTR